MGPRLSDRPSKRTRAVAHQEGAVRLINVLSFLSGHPGIPLKALAAHFHMEVAAMRRLIEESLIQGGVAPYGPDDHFSVWIDKSHAEQPVRLHKHDYFRAPLSLSSLELLALRRAVAGATRHADGETRSIAKRLLARLEGRKPKPAAARDASDDPETSDGEVVEAPLADTMAEQLQTMEQAVLQRRKLRIEYYSASRGELSNRVVQPWLLFEEAARFYLRGLCEQAGAARSFRCDRVKSVELLPERFPVPAKSATKKPTAVPGHDGLGDKGEFSVRFEPRLADELEEEWVARGAKAERTLDGSLILTLPLYSEAWAVSWVLSYGCDAELLGPKHLRRDVVAQVGRMLRGVA
jgi:proteasome accessory factor C